MRYIISHLLFSLNSLMIPTECSVPAKCQKLDVEKLVLKKLWFTGMNPIGQGTHCGYHRNVLPRRKTKHVSNLRPLHTQETHTSRGHNCQAAKKDTILLIK